MTLRFRLAMLFFFLLSTFVPCIPWAQSTDTTVKGTQQNIKILEQKIKAEKEKQEKAKQEEKSVTRQLAVINQRVRVRNRELQILQGQLKRNEQQTQKLQSELQTTQEKLKTYQEYLANRVRAIYRANKVSPYQQILAATDYLDETRRVRYERTIAYADAKYVADTQYEAKKLNRQKFDLNDLLHEQKIRQNEISRSKKLYLNQQNEKTTLLAKVQSDQVLHAKAVKEYEAAKQRLEKLLERLIAEAQKFPSTAYHGEGIGALKGKLMWPVTVGSLLYGPGSHQGQFGNELTSKGIGIKAAIGTPVYAVHDGMVEYAGWLEGSGNVIYINHGQDYRTVYMHLHSISVKKGDIVKRQQVIGTVGESGSLEGPQLEFQIRKGLSSLDPQDWLAKQ